MSKKSFVFFYISLALCLARPLQPIKSADGLIDKLIQVLSRKELEEDTQRLREYPKMSAKELNEKLETIDEDGQSISYTLFAPTSSAFLREIPQDIADPFSQDSELRLKVLLRHFAKQNVTKGLREPVVITLKMADSQTAALSLGHEGKNRINDAEIISKSVPIPGGLGSIYLVDRAFVSPGEISESIAKFPSPSIGWFFPGTTEEAPTADQPDLPDEIASRSTERSTFSVDAGSYTPQDPKDPIVVEMAQFAAAAISQARNAEEPLNLIEVVSAASQVVAGMNYKLKISLRDPSTSEQTLCDVVVFYRSWTNTRTLTSSACLQQ